MKKNRFNMVLIIIPVLIISLMHSSCLDVEVKENGERETDATISVGPICFQLSESYDLGLTTETVSACASMSDIPVVLHDLIITNILGDASDSSTEQMNADSTVSSCAGTGVSVECAFNLALAPEDSSVAPVYLDTLMKVYEISSTTVPIDATSSTPNFKDATTTAPSYESICYYFAKGFDATSYYLFIGDASSPTYSHTYVYESTDATDATSATP